MNMATKRKIMKITMQARMMIFKLLLPVKGKEKNCDKSSYKMGYVLNYLRISVNTLQISSIY
ncbi:hypothetical protein LguiB_005838 [Lonicera macranthoides]